MSEAQIQRAYETVIEATQLLVLVAEKVKALHLVEVDAEFGQRMTEMEDRLLALIVEEWREQAS